MNIRVLSAFAVFVAMVALFAGTVSAASVALVNPNFDDQSLSDGSQANLPSGWVAVYGTDASTNFVRAQPHVGRVRRRDGNGLLPSPAAGSQAAFNASSIGGGTGAYDIAVLDDYQGRRGPAQPLITLQAGQTYTETIAVGQGLTTPNPLGGGVWANYFDGFSILMADVTQGGLLVNQEFDKSLNPVPGTFQDFSLTINGSDYISADPDNGPQAGDELAIGFIIGAQTYITNVRLDVSSVPEPSSLVLVASGLIGLLAYAWRRRAKTS